MREFSFNKSHLLKKWHYLDLLCVVKVVTITTGFTYSTRSPHKVAFSGTSMSSACSNHSNHSNMSPLKNWHFLHLVCAIYIATLKTKVYFTKSHLL